MRIQIELGESLKSPHDGKTLLPQIKVASTLPLSVYGLYDNKPSFLELKNGGDIYTATFFLHENITAHLHSGKFNIFVTNTRFFIGCLITNEETAFTTTLEREFLGDKEVDISDTLMQHFCILDDEEVFTVEPLRFPTSQERNTDKHVSI